LRFGLTEVEIKAGLAAGGRLRRVYITAEIDDGKPLYRVYLRSTWSRSFLPMRSWLDRADRTYRDLDRAVLQVREFGYRGFITLCEADDPRLARHRAFVDQSRSNTPLKAAKPRKPRFG